MPLMEGRGFYSRGKWDAGRLYGIFMSLSRGWIPRRGDGLPRDGLSCLGILSFGGRRGFICAFSGRGAARPGKRHGMKPISSGQGLHAPSATIWKVCILMPCYRLYIRGDATTFHIIIIIKRERSVTSTTAPSIHHGSCPRARARRNSHRPALRNSASATLRPTQTSRARAPRGRPLTQITHSIIPRWILRASGSSYIRFPAVYSRAETAIEARGDRSWRRKKRFMVSTRGRRRGSNYKALQLYLMCRVNHRRVLA